MAKPQARPYGLTENDHYLLHQTRNSLRMLQYLTEAQHQGPLEPELLGSMFWTLANQLDQILESTNQN